MSGRMPGVAASALVALLGATLAGCTAGSEDPSPPPTPSATAGPVSAAPAGGVVASGAFTTVDGSPDGTVEATASGDLLTFTVAGVADQEGLSLRLPFDPDPADPCADGPGFAFGALGVDDAVFPLSFGHGDPTFLTEIVLVRAGTGTDGCINTIVARAPLEWSSGPVRTQLAVLTDAGSSPGASGPVTDADGRPVSYEVAEGDTLGQVAERFGVTEDDILYLNPTRSPSPDDPTLYAGETLNLDLASR